MMIALLLPLFMISALKYDKSDEHSLSLIDYLTAGGNTKGLLYAGGFLLFFILLGALILYLYKNEPQKYE